jgi:hypothetical protein
MPITNREQHVTSPHDFDTGAFFAAVDAQRHDQHLSWPALANAIWDQSLVLNQRRNDHPIRPATIKNMAEGRGLSCQHALFVLRWLGVPPETFIASPEPALPGSLFLWRTSHIAALEPAQALWGAQRRPNRAWRHVAAGGGSPALHDEPTHRSAHRKVRHRHAVGDAHYPGAASPGSRFRRCNRMVA